MCRYIGSEHCYDVIMDAAVTVGKIFTAHPPHASRVDLSNADHARSLSATEKRHRLMMVIASESMMIM